MITVGYKHYTDEVAAEFPDVDKKAVEAVVRHGLLMMCFFRKSNQDIFLNNNMQNFYFYFGDVTNDIQKRYAKSSRKLRNKRRILYTLQKTQYSGYYYFMLNAEDYELHLQAKPVPRVCLFKIMDEALSYRKGEHLFRVKLDEGKWLIMKENYETSNTEYIQQRSSNGPKPVDDTK
jgi:hypothetical protein